MKNDYSEKEFAMIAILSPLWAGLIKDDKTSSIMPPQVLDIVGLQCFMDRKESPAADSLRRCIMACHKCKPYRMTKEYDDLIQL